MSHAFLIYQSVNFSSKDPNNTKSSHFLSSFLLISTIHPIEIMNNILLRVQCVQDNIKNWQEIRQ